MPILKPISGHGSAAGIQRYLEKQGRALARDMLNLPMEEWIEEPGGAALRHFDWAAEMDKTREAFGTSEPWKGRAARTFKHFVVSPDPQDAIDLSKLRTLAQAWVNRYFPEHEAVIVYHDDNKGNIPHAHIVVNNANLETGRRMHTDFPEDLNRDLQDMARALDLSALSNTRTPGKKDAHPRSRQAVYFGRAEREILEAGNYSWVSDIRARVALAKNTTRTEEDFRRALTGLGVTVSDNSASARRDDWIFALADTPTRRVSGERLGMTFGKEMLLMRFARQSAYCPTPRSAREIRAMATRAVELNDLEDLHDLASSIETCAKFDIRSMADFDRRMQSLERRGSAQTEGYRRIVVARDYMRDKNLLPRNIGQADSTALSHGESRMRGSGQARQQSRIQEQQRMQDRDRGQR